MQYSVDKPWILAFMCMPIDTFANSPLQIKYTSVDTPDDNSPNQQDKHRSSQKNITEG